MSAEDSEAKCLLRRAFGTELSGSAALSHEDCLALRSKLLLLRPSDVRECLPQVLIDLVDFHTGDMNRTEDVEEVVWFLDPDEDELGECGEGDVPALRKHKALVYGSFSPLQCAAVAKWLQLAAGWSDLQLQREQVEIALRSWAKKEHRAQGDGWEDGVKP